MALGSAAEISSCGAWRGSLDCHKQENVDEFCALALMRAVEDVKTACLHVDTTERTRGASMLRVWLHLPQSLRRASTLLTPNALDTELAPVTGDAPLRRDARAVSPSPLAPASSTPAQSRAVATERGHRKRSARGPSGVPSLARRLRERGRQRARKEVKRSMWRDIKLQVRSFTMWGVVMYHRPLMMSITRAANCCCCVLISCSRRTGGLARALVRSVCLSSTSTRPRGCR